MKRILVLVDAYLPYPSPNGTCMRMVIEEMQQRGYQTVCITNIYRGGKKHEIIDNTGIFRIRKRFLERYQDWCSRNSSCKCIKLARFFLLQLNRVKFFFIMRNWPLCSPALAGRYFRRAVKLHRENPFDAVIAVHYSPESMLAAHRLKNKFPHIKFIVYFLDTLSGSYPPKHFTKEQAIAHGQKLERRLLENADLAVVMESSRQHHETYNKDAYYYDNLTYLDIPMLVKNTAATAPSGYLNKTKINLVYVGSTLSYVRSPLFFLHAFEKIKNENLVLTIVGLTDLHQLYAEYSAKLGDRFRYIPFLAQKTAAVIVNEADILLNFGNVNPAMVPCKIFEYMSSGKPVISTYPIDNEPSIEYLKHYPSTLLLDERREDYERAAEEIEGFIIHTKNTQVDFEQLCIRFPKNTPSAFVDLLDKLFK